MKKFLGRAALFCVLLLFLTVGFLGLSTTKLLGGGIAELTNSADFSATGWRDMTLRALEGARANPDAEVLVMGDSVAVQLFLSVRQQNPRYCITHGNSAFLLIGQYAFASEFIKTHPNASQILLILRPPSLGEQINSRYSYGFVALPFADKERIQYLTPNARAKMQSVYGSFALNERFINICIQSPLIMKLYNNIAAMIKPYVLPSGADVSEESIEYLSKLVQLCEENDVELVILASPLVDDAAFRDNEAMMQAKLEENGLLSHMPYYFDSLLYYPANTLFGDPLVHFRTQYIDTVRADVVEHFRKVAGVMEDFVY